MSTSSTSHFLNQEVLGTAYKTDTTHRLFHLSSVCCVLHLLKIAVRLCGSCRVIVSVPMPMLLSLSLFQVKLHAYGYKEPFIQPHLNGLQPTGIHEVCSTGNRCKPQSNNLDMTWGSSYEWEDEHHTRNGPRNLSDSSDSAKASPLRAIVSALTPIFSNSSWRPVKIIEGYDESISTKHQKQNSQAIHKENSQAHCHSPSMWFSTMISPHFAITHIPESNQTKWENMGFTLGYVVDPEHTKERRRNKKT